jgi:two-component system, OmpR family, response regulator
MSRASRQRPRILVVEDDLSMRNMLIRYLQEQNLDVVAAARYREAIRQFRVHEPDLMILDLQLDRNNGFDLLHEIRPQSNVPVIIITAHWREEVDRITGLELGADAYFTKPFCLRELLARLKALLRRSKADYAPRERDEEAGAYEFDGWRLDRKTRRLIDPQGALVLLTKNEYRLLIALLDTPGRPLTREHLLQATRIHDDILDRGIDVLISRLRRKLEIEPSAPRIIQTERRLGYRFAVPVNHRK